MVLDSDQSCQLFNVDGLHLANFSVNIQGDRYYRIACHPVGEHVVVAGEERETHLLIVAIYTVNGDLRVYKYTKIQGPRFQRNYIIARDQKSDLHGMSIQSSPKISRMLITRPICIQ